MFEKPHEPVAPRSIFFRRMFYSLLLASGLVMIVLLIGVIGYRYTEGLSWLDAFLNASMVLSDMGQISPLSTTAGKIFASLYALFSGLVFVTIISILFAPMVHRLLHTFHND